MPQITLTYTANLPAAAASRELLLGLHSILATTGGVRLGNCKSRILAVDRFAVGDGGVDEAFVHLDVRLLAGRTTERKRQVGEEMLALLRAAYGERGGGLQITVEIRDIQPEEYFKHPQGTLGGA